MSGLLRFDVYGTLVGIEREAGGWRANILGDGKHRRADFVVPAFIEQDALAQFLADLFHESASPRHPEVRALDPSPAPRYGRQTQDS